MMFTQKPKQVRYLGNVYTINDDYRNILQAMIYLEGLDRDDFESDYDFNFEQSMIVVHMIFGKDAPIHQALVNKANDVMWNYVENRDTKESEPIYQDLIQDYPIYKMDILREFNREIEKLPYLSWSDFIDMVGSLSGDSNMAQYVKIRSTPLKEIDKDKRSEFKALQDKIKIKTKDKVVEDKRSIFEKFEDTYGNRKE